MIALHGKKTEVKPGDTVLFRVWHERGVVACRIERDGEVFRWKAGEPPEYHECVTPGIRCATELGREATLLVKAFGCAGVKRAKITDVLTKDGWIGFTVV